MKYVQIKKNNIGAFKWISDVDELGRIVNGTDTFAIGAVEEEHGWGVGILSFSVLKDNSIMHRWIYVATEFRYKGIATEMMHRFYDLIADLNISKFFVVFPNNNRAQMLMSFYERFEYHFERSKMNNMHVRLSEVAGHSLFRSHKIPNNTLSLESVSPSEIKYFMGAIPKEWREHSRHISIGDPDNRISSVYLDHDKICGALIIHHTPSGKLLPVFFRSLKGDGKIMVSLVRKTVQEAMKKYGPDTEVIINLDQTAIGTFIDKLFPDKVTVNAWRGEHGS